MVDVVEEKTETSQLETMSATVPPDLPQNTDAGSDYGDDTLSNVSAVIFTMLPVNETLASHFGKGYTTAVSTLIESRSQENAFYTSAASTSVSNKTGEGIGQSTRQDKLSGRRIMKQINYEPDGNVSCPVAILPSQA